MSAPENQTTDPWIAEMVAKIAALTDDDIKTASRISAALLKTAIRHRPKNDALRRAILADAIGVAAVATGEAV